MSITNFIPTHSWEVLNQPHKTYGHIIDEEEFFDPDYDYDFTDLKDTETFYRGGEVYERPCGWKHYALKVLLLDLPAPALQPQEKLLIDLTNTPNLIRTGKTCTTTQQLINLSSPLIKWSPEDKRENNAPLINLSF
ncbi:hypothetical protein L3Q82_007155 [Scortum barcoo]|uniref:Uncharacterized protein n=1 Tax=Scortum barcoo TaxID=214431 RepID=A0ACB8WS11_9TELE|nr:hypothetical protein L3Q82_007155 [Scortum barcoo]